MKIYSLEKRALRSMAVIDTDDLVQKQGYSMAELDAMRRLTEGDFEPFIFPLRFQHISGTRWSDMLWGLSLIIVSDNFVAACQANNLTGWSSYPIEIFSRGGELVAGYNGFSITGRCGPVDHTKAERLNPSSAHGHTWHLLGLNPGMDAWDGSDLFMAPNSLRHFTTEQAAHALAGLSNVKFNDVSKEQYNIVPHLHGL